MIKNQSNIYRFPMEDYLGKGVTGLAPTIKLSKDGGTFAAATNSVTEPDTTNAPGLYQLILTAEECNCNLLTLVVNVPTGEWGAILTEFEMQSPSDTSGLATAEALSAVATNVSAVKAKTDALPEHPAAVGSEMALTSAAIAAAQNGLATSEALSTVDGVVDAIKAKTDNLPASPAAVGSAMTLTEATVSTVKSGLATGDNIEAALGAIEMYGDTNWMTADLSDVSTFDPETDAVTLTDAYNAAKTASQLTTSDLSALATSEELTALASVANDTLAGMLYWRVVDDTLITYGSTGSIRGQYTITKDSTGNIIKIEPIPSNDGN